MQPCLCIQLKCHLFSFQHHTTAWLHCEGTYFPLGMLSLTVLISERALHLGSTIDSNRTVDPGFIS